MRKILISIFIVGMFLTTIPNVIVGQEAVSEEQPVVEELFNVDEGTLFEYVSEDGELMQYMSNNDSEKLPKFVPGEVIVKFKEDVQIEILESTSGLLESRISSGKSLDGSKGVEEPLEGALTTGIESIDQLNTEYGVISIEELFPDTTIQSLSNIYKFTFPGDSEIIEIVSGYNVDDNVVYAEPNYIFTTSYAQRPTPKLIPNDSYIFEQWGIHNTAQYRMYLDFDSVDYKFDADIDAPEAWYVKTGNPSVVIAIVDTGVDYNHPDLAANIWHDPINGNPGYDFVDINTAEYIAAGYTLCPDEDYTVPDGNPMDVVGHGTHCAGIAGAVSNNSLGVAGVSWNCKIMPVRNGFKIIYDGTYGMMEEDDSAFAIIYASTMGADVISMSWGGYYKSQLIRDALDYAYSMNVVLVAAAGNDNSNAKSYPACYDNVISVAATSPDDKKALFSNYGETVDVGAPGEFILSTIPTQMTGGYGSFSNLFVDSQKINSRPLYRSVLGTANGNIVYVGKATTAELEGINLTGKIALILRHQKFWMLHSQINNVQNKGAIGSIFFNYDSGSFWTWIYQGSNIPAVSIPREDALNIIQKLEQGKVVTADLNVYTDAYQYYRGTSMACPYVAGLAGLLISKNIQCPYPAQMAKSMIPFTSDNINTGYDLGGGRINAFKALNQKPFAAILDPIDNWEDVKGTIDIRGAAWGENFQYYVLEDGLGENPSSWTTLKTKSFPEGGILLSLDTKTKSEGLHTIRLKVVCSYGTFTDEIQIFINNQADGTYTADLYVSNCFDESTPGWFVTHFPGINWALVEKAKAGDTIFVYDGIYREKIILLGEIKDEVLFLLRSSISLIGQSKDWTIIDSSVHISLSSKITVERFTIRRPLILDASSKCLISQNKFEVTNDLEWGIDLKLSSNNNIKSNNFKGLSYPLGTGGIMMQRSSDNTVSDNYFSDLTTSIGIGGFTSSRNTVSGNTIYGYYLRLPGPFGWSSQLVTGSYGIDLTGGRNNVVNNNIIKTHFFSISLCTSLQSEITKNYISESTVGVWSQATSSFNKIVANDINAIDFSICFSPMWDGETASYNKIYYNNIHGGLPYDVYDVTLNNGTTNVWYEEKLFGKDMGNYYHNYEEFIREYVGEEPKDENNDGIWDIPYPIPPLNNIEECKKDLYPVVNPIDIENIDVSTVLNEELTTQESEYLAQLEETINNQILSGELNTNYFMSSYKTFVSITSSQSQQSSQQSSQSGSTTQQSTTGSITSK